MSHLAITPHIPPSSSISIDSVTPALLPDYVELFMVFLYYRTTASPSQAVGLLSVWSIQVLQYTALITAVY
jgi:hypothetical protein